MSKRFLAILVAVVVGLGLLFWFTGGNKSNSSNGSGSQPTNHIQGTGAKGVTLVEYGDFQCPVCEAYYPVVKQVTTQFSNDIFFQFRNLPLIQIHQNAFAAARAAEAADKQGKYWEMHDMLYAQTNWQVWTQSSSPQTLFDGYAQQLGLDVTKFKQDYASTEVNNLINADLSEFDKTGQQKATPSFFINGKYVANSALVDSNGPSAAKFSAAINAAIAAKSPNQ
jgi:protein-disulfide isomerase